MDTYIGCHGNSVSGSSDCYPSSDPISGDYNCRLSIATMIGCHEHPPCSEADACEGCMYDGNGNSVSGSSDCMYDYDPSSGDYNCRLSMDTMIGCHEHPPCTEADACEGCMFDGNDYSLNGGTECTYDPGLQKCYRNDLTSSCVYIPRCSSIDYCAGCTVDGNGNSVSGSSDCYDSYDSIS